jgi:lipoprotein NlpI
MRRLGVMSLPRIVGLDAEGRQVPQALPEEIRGTRTSTTDVVKVLAEGLRWHEEGQFGRALRCFAAVVEAQPSHADAAFNAAAILHMCGQTLLAVHYTAQVRQLPATHHPWLRVCFGAQAARSLVCSVGVQALEARPNDATAHNLLGSVLAESEPQAVIEAYRRLVESNPSNHRAKHRLAVLTGEGGSARTAEPAYVAQVFDELADTFEAKLVDHLQYKVGGR